jgi:phage FluMu protein Com
MQMPGTHTVSRCAQCGALLASISEPVGQCPKCKFELHSCRQCTYFDTSSRFECTQPIPERIARKDERNQCTFYSMRVRVEKETSTPSAARPLDARAAFENLFKK